MDLPNSLRTCAAALLLLSVAPATAGERCVYISDKINPPFAAGNTDVLLAKITPDGKRVLYLQSKGDRILTGKTLRSVPVTGGKPVTLLEKVAGYAAAFQATDDSQFAIALAEDGSGKQAVYSISLTATTGPVWLGSSDIPFRLEPLGRFGGSSAIPFVLSPDGSQLAFASAEDGLICASPATGRAVAVSSPIEFVSGLGFSADSQTIYFVGRNPASFNSFYAAPVDGSAPPAALFLGADGATPVLAGADNRLTAGGSAIISTTRVGRSLRSIQKFTLGTASPATIAEFPFAPTSSSFLEYSQAGLHLFVLEGSLGLDPTTLHLINLVEGTQVVLNTLAGINAPILSPDASHVLYGGDSEMWIQPVDGSPPTPLTPVSTLGFKPIGFNSDGTRAVFTGRSAASSANQIFSCLLDGSEFVSISLPIAAPRDLGELVQISHDGQHLLYTLDTGGQVDDDYLYRVAITGGENELMHRIGVPGGDVDALIQNPDGSGIAFIADLNDNAVDELFYRRYDEPDASILSERGSGDGRLSEFAATADSRFAVYLAQQFTPGIDELVAVPTTGGSARRLNRPPVTKGDVRPGFQLSPNGKYAVFRGDLDTNTVTELYAAPIEGSADVKLHPDLSEASKAEVEAFKISPDSQHVVFYADIDSNSKFDIYLAAIDGSSFRKITPDFDSGDAGMFLFSPDSQLVLFNAPDPAFAGTTRFFVHDIESATTTRHPTMIAPYEVTFSPGGRNLLLQNGLSYRLTTVSGEVEYHVGSGHSATFTADGDQLIHIDSNGSLLYATDVPTGVTRLLFSPQRLIRNLVTDGDRAIILTGLENDWQIVAIPIYGGEAEVLHVRGDTSAPCSLQAFAGGGATLFSVGEELWLCGSSPPERVNPGYQLSGAHLLIPGTSTGFFVGRPADSGATPALYYFDPDIDEGPTVSAVRPVSGRGVGPLHQLVMTQDRRQLLYLSDIDTPGIFELYAATGGTRVTRFASGDDDALESAGATDAAAPAALFTQGNFTGLRFDQLPSGDAAPLYSANLTLTASADLSGVARELRIGIQDDADPAAFMTAATPGISTRALAPGIETIWAIDTWTAGQRYTTPDLSEHFEFLFAKPDWQDYNAAVLTISSGSQSAPHRAWLSEGNVAAPPQLELIFRSDVSFGELERLNFADWAAQNGLADASADADLDGDGLSLGVEYAFRLDPNSPDPPPAPDVQLRQVTTDGVMQVYIEFERDPQRTSAIITLETSTDLQRWHPITTSTLGAPTNHSNENTTIEGNRNVFVTLPPIPPGSEIEDTFLRFRVTIP